MGSSYRFPSGDFSLEFQVLRATIVHVKKLSAILVFSAAALLGAQAQIGQSKFDKGPIAGIPTTFTNAQSVTLNQTVSGTYKPILLNASTLAPIAFRLRSTGAGTNAEGRFTVVFGNSIDGKNFWTNGTWVSTFGTNGVTTKTTNWVHGAIWPYQHVLSVAIVTNTATSVVLEYSQPSI